MLDGVAQRVRALIADHLGVGAEDMGPHVSLRDDLAADSLDLLEVSVALEDDLGIGLPERVLADVRTVGELIDAVVAAARNRRVAVARSESPAEPVRVGARVIPAAGSGRPTLDRTEWLTPYAVEAIVDDALHAGRGARLEVVLGANVPAADVARVAERFQALGARGIDVQVRREGQGAHRRTILRSTPDAARA
ncbi:MAG: acyl carrier protein [bacterium]|nr:acyl carrier protein [bacterium]